MSTNNAFSLKQLAIGVYARIPEGRPRHELRRLLLTTFNRVSKLLYINPGDCVVQVGTPSPGMIRWYLSIVGDNGRVVVVEPEKANFARLEDDPVLREAPNVTLIKRAAWSCRQASSPPVAVSTACPSFISARVMNSRALGSSSTIRMRMHRVS